MARAAGLAAVRVVRAKRSRSNPAITTWATWRIRRRNRRRLIGMDVAQAASGTKPTREEMTMHRSFAALLILPALLLLGGVSGCGKEETPKKRPPRPVPVADG